MAWTDISKVGSAAEASVKRQERGTHADEIETSMILFMQPASVRMDKAVADGEHAAPGPMTRDPKRKDLHYSPSGVFGDPTLATWQKGEQIVEATVADILKDIDALAGEPLPTAN